MLAHIINTIEDTINDYRANKPLYKIGAVACIIAGIILGLIILPFVG